MTLSDFGLTEKAEDVQHCNDLLGTTHFIPKWLFDPFGPYTYSVATDYASLGATFAAVFGWYKGMQNLCGFSVLEFCEEYPSDDQRFEPLFQLTRQLQNNQVQSIEDFEERVGALEEVQSKSFQCRR